MQAKTQTKSSTKNEKLNQTNPTKIYLLQKLLKLLPLRKNLIPLNIHISIICSRPNLVFEIGPVLCLHDLKRNHWPEAIQ